MLRSVNIDKIGDPKNPDIVYYNLDIISGKDIDEGEGSYPLAKFNETRDSAIIGDCSKYNMSIVRFTMNGCDKTLPMFIPRIELGQSDPNKTAYHICMKVTIDHDFGGVIGQISETFYTDQPLIWQPQNLKAKNPNPPLQKLELIDYYFAYNYDHIVNLINNTYQACFNDITAQWNTYVAGLAGPPAPVPIVTTVPQLYYNPQSKLFELYCDTYGFGGAKSQSHGTNSAEDFQLYFNSNMFGLFSNYPHFYEGGDLATKNIEQKLNFAYKIITTDQRLGLNVIEGKSNVGVDTGIYYWRVFQDYQSTSTLWSPISSIVFTSTLLPVNNEQTGVPVKYGTGNTNNAVGTASNFSPIITDISLPLDNAYGYNEFVSYIPSAEYRISALSNSPQEVRSIDINVFWKSRLTGELVPVELFNLSNISVKIMFRKREYY